VEVHVSDQPAVAAALFIARTLRNAIDRQGAGTIAVSGGSTAPALFAALADIDLDWRVVDVWQVDERVAPDGHPARNVAQLAAVPWRVHPMPVTAVDLDDAAADYGAGLPGRFDVVHLGVGDDGHTASWPPGDPVILSGRPCVVVDTFNGYRRMTLTPIVVNQAQLRVVLATGAAKAQVVARWLAGDPTLPISAVDDTDTSVFLDDAAAAEHTGLRNRDPSGK
jgi:6-phosphogluconolactonase/glucosamine-6-phosphate isomerase/deaminase